MTGIIWALYLIPMAGFIIAVVDGRGGFRLFMGGAAFAFLLLTLAMHVWTRALNGGVVRIAESGPLRFLPPPILRVMFVVVAIAMLIPGIVSLIVAGLELPTMAGSTRFTTVAPYALAIVGVVSLAMLLWSVRTPAGLTVDARGLRGVRGGKKIDLDWENVAETATIGPHGPKLAIHTRDGATIVLDAHQLGSDPAIVAAVIEFYRQHPAEREHLANGTDAVRALEGFTNA